ncbi:nascent polypeptide-associated complex subunit alpha, muscle-specific form isoform X2 [Aphidius gifuensis]|uniref:nascent polypeptide-associated complex subunit alpha, muscle-specific form isoform X2 n=1 Tax=Aphidius gifuensis TaxID=684658 RepID=UPI001CDD8FB3|nr:nascent polypeptide-associated complex subunit alpha, muscle-specific form isoform X2 [Aphidius gifuensis]
MESSQLPRTPDDPGVGRGMPMQRQNQGPPANYQPRPQGPPLGPARYPVNNGPQPLNRLDSKTSLNSPTGQPIQFAPPRPQFGPPRQPQGGQPIPPGGYPRGPPPQNNPGLQGPRYPPPGSSPGIREPLYQPQPGQRPIFNNNQQQQQVRFQRPELGGPQSQIRFAPQQYNPENRPLAPRIIPNTGVVTAPPTYPTSTPRDFNSERKPPIYPQNRGKMEIEINQNTSSPSSDKKRTASRNENIMDDDDDDVVIDSEKESKSSLNEKRSETPLSKPINSPLSSSPNIIQTSSPEPRAPSSASIKHEISANSSPVGSRNSTPAPTDEQRPKSQLSDLPKTPELDNTMTKSPSPSQNNDNELIDDKSRTSSAKSNRSPTKVEGQIPESVGSSPGTKSPLASPSKIIENKLPDDDKSRTSSAKSNRSPTKFDEQLPESIASSPGAKSPGVMGFDNGKPRSLSPKSPTPVSSPVPSIPEKPATPVKSPSRPQTPVSLMKRSVSGRSMKSAGNENGENQTSVCNSPKINGVSSIKKPPSSKPKEANKPKPAGSPLKSPTKSVKSMPRTPEASLPPVAEKKKVPMNKVQVGAAPSPNLKTVRSKIGSLENASYKPGGGRVKIENRKLDFSNAQPKIAAKNDKYAPSGGEKKIPQVKLQWNAKPKVGSLANTTYKPGGGDKKIETVKLDFKDKAKPKVGSKENAKHVPGGGTVKTEAIPSKIIQESSSHIETQKIDIKAESKIGSLENVKHKPGGGDKKIFNDRDYLRQTGSNAESVNGSGRQAKNEQEQEPNPPPSTPTKTRSSSVTTPVSAEDLLTSLQAKSPSKTSKSGSSTPKSARQSKSPIASRPNSLDLKSPDKSSSNSSRKSSPGHLYLPKLTNLMTNNIPTQEPQSQITTSIKLPKLTNTSTVSGRAGLAQ